MIKTENTTDNTKVRSFAARFHKGPATGSDAGGETAYNSDYGAGVVFENDASDGAEYLDTIRRKIALEPERHLMLAILEDAIVSFQKNLHARNAKKRAQFEEAEAWILDEKDSALFSFESICDLLGVEPTYLRRGLIAWKKENSPARAA